MSLLHRILEVALLPTVMLRVVLICRCCVVFILALLSIAFLAHIQCLHRVIDSLGTLLPYEDAIVFCLFLCSADSC